MERGDSYFLKIAKNYFAKWVAAQPSDLDKKGICVEYSEEREKRQKGYGKRIDLYCFSKDETSLICYGSRTEEKIQEIVTAFRWHRQLLFPSVQGYNVTWNR